MTAPTIAAALRDAAAGLAATSDTARLDAELLMAHALGVSRSDLLLRHMHDAPPATFAALVERRARHEPVAHILGHQEFYGLDLQVTPDTLIPRGDSETLIDVAQTLLAERPPARVIDLGTGTGALLLAALTVFPQANGIGIERSAPALDIARVNAARLGLADRADMRNADWTQAGWAAQLGHFDLILANPPYVETGADLAPGVRHHEPAAALFAGADGLDDYRVLIPQLPALLTPGGLVLIEIGATQDREVGDLARAAGFAVTLHRDLAGRPRALALSAR